MIPTERSIILRPHEVRGLLGGTVTQLWRPLKAGQYARSYHSYEGDADDDGWPLACSVVSGHLTRVVCPWGEVGQRLWGKEGWLISAYDEVLYLEDWRGQGYEWRGMGWKSPIHMPRRYSRLALQIVQVNARRVRDATLEDMRASGARPDTEASLLWRETLTENFRRQWDQDNPRYPQESNPWAWQLIVRRIES